MGINFRLNRFDMFALGAVIVTTMLFIDAAINAAGVYTRVVTMSAWDKAEGCLGWFLATFGPIAISVVFWRWSKRFRAKWIPHLLMIPFSFALLISGEFLMLAVIGTPDFDDTIGGPIIQAYVLLILSVCGYYLAVLHAASTRRPEHANVR